MENPRAPEKPKWGSVVRQRETFWPHGRPAGLVGGGEIASRTFDAKIDIARCPARDWTVGNHPCLALAPDCRHGASESLLAR